MAQVLVDGLPADPVVPGKDGFRNTVAGALNQLGRPFRRESLFPAFVCAALLGQGDAFPLAFPDEGAFEFGEGTMTESMRLAMGESSPVKTRLSLTNSTMGILCQALDQGTQVIEVAGEPVHAVHNHGVPVAGEPQQLGQLWPGGVSAGGVVREDPVQNLAIELAFLVLVQRAYSHVPDSLSSHLRLPRPCQVEF